MPIPRTVSEYITSAPPAARKALREIRAAIRKATPGITERISYRMPTFDLDGKYLMYMAAFKDHVSIYPATASMMRRFGTQLAPLRSGAGTIRFALGRRLPLGLITKLAKLRVAERRTKKAAARLRTPAGRARKKAARRARQATTRRATHATTRRGRKA
jgi:uncharacterized protein YdhG (YjbR/CyaY superfamily)